MAINWQTVNSSAISRVGWEPGGKGSGGYGTLFVEFQKRGTYAFLDVHSNTFRAMIDSASVGGFYNTYIADNYFSVRG